MDAAQKLPDPDEVETYQILANVPGTEVPTELSLQRTSAALWLIEHGLASHRVPDRPEKPPSTDKALSQGNPRQGLRIVGTVKGGPPKATAVTVCLEDVEAEEVDWLWQGRIPLGSVSIIVGDPGAGKSTLTGAITTHVTLGASWPDDPEAPAVAGSVVILTAEENLATDLRPRLEKFGADISKVHILTTVERESGSLAPFSLARDVPALEDAVRKIGDVRLIIIDPVGSYVGGADSHNDAEVRAALAPLFGLAEKRRLAVLLVAHLTKGGSTNVLYRISGSIAFVAMSRMAWFLSKHPHDPSRRLLTYVKGNPADALTTGLSFGYMSGRMVWDEELVRWTADDVARLLQAESEKLKLKPPRGPQAKEANKAVDFLMMLLASGPCLQSAAAEKALQLGFTESTFRKALKHLRYEAGKVERFHEPGDERLWLRLSAPPESKPEGGAAT